MVRYYSVNYLKQRVYNLYTRTVSEIVHLKLTRFKNVIIIQIFLYTLCPNKNCGPELWR